MKQTVLSHLEELRKGFIIVLASMLFLFILCYLFSNTIVAFLKNDLLKDITIIATNPVEVIITKLSISLYLALFLSIPIILYQVVLFVKPALNKRERWILYFGSFVFFVLFVTGVLFSYFVVLKFGIAYLAKMATDAGVENYWSFKSIMSFVFVLTLCLGLVFELPLLMFIVNKIGLINLKEIKKFRPYVYIAIFFFAAVITPTIDPFTQIIVAVPLIILFEISALVIRIT